MDLVSLEPQGDQHVAIIEEVIGMARDSHKTSTANVTVIVQYLRAVEAVRKKRSDVLNMQPDQCFYVHNFAIDETSCVSD